MSPLTHLDQPHDRVRDHTSTAVNERIDAKTRTTIDDALARGHDTIVRRLAELDREWDIDRALLVLFPVVGGATFLTGLARYAKRPILGLFGKRRKGLLRLFTAQLGFILMHGVVGWCPPVVVLRRLGFRTQREIQGERRALEDALA